ncbi:MAG: flagellar hook-basal body complex protein FliE [Gemmataceae bacterium]
MSLTPLSSGTSSSAVGGGSAAPAAGSGLGGFSRVLAQFLNDASGQQAHAEQAVQNLAAGRADNVHNVMLSMAKADLSFHLVLEMRNRISDAYQEIMRMQV